MTHTRSSFFAIAIAAAVAQGCKDREPEPRPSPAPPPVAAPSRSAAELTGWPAGIGRALVLRLAAPDDAYRLVVPELGDRRFADSALAVRAGDTIPMALLGRRGKAGDGILRVVDSEAGSGACVTWPSVEIGAPSYARRSGAATWRLAAERDSVTAILVDSLMGMPSADSAALVNAVNSVHALVPAAPDSALRGIPFSIRRAYAFRVAGIATVAAELVRTSSSEADPREERLFVVGERPGLDANPRADRLVYSRRVAGRADSTSATELLVALVGRQSSRPVLVLSVEDARGVRLLLLERGGRRWRLAWSSAVTFC